MPARILDGRRVAEQVTGEVREAIARRVAAGRPIPGLAVVQVGEHTASSIYVRNKRRTTESVGMRSVAIDLPSHVTQDELLSHIARLDADASVNGILVQLPLPAHVAAEAVIERIDPRKDVDGFHPYNMGRLALGMPKLRPCTPAGCMRLLRETGEPLKGRHAVVVGRSTIVGRPMALELLLEHCTVTICHSATRDLPAVVRSADIVVAALGRPGFVQGDWIREGAIVIDVGINRTPEGKLVGDVEFDAARARASFITPVPGGVGPMTIATLLANTLRAAELQEAGALQAADGLTS